MRRLALKLPPVQRIAAVGRLVAADGTVREGQRGILLHLDDMTRTGTHLVDFIGLTVQATIQHKAVQVDGHRFVAGYDERSGSPMLPASLMLTLLPVPIASVSPASSLTSACAKVPCATRQTKATIINSLVFIVMINSLLKHVIGSG